MGELKARVCGDERAAKRAAARVDAAQKKRKALPPPPMYQVPVDKKPKVAKKPPPPPDDEPEPFSDAEILNVLRLTRRVAAGANVSNLKKLCAAAGLANVGSKAQLASRLERFLREKNFEAHPFIPSHEDCLLPFAEFDAKYEQTVLEIGWLWRGVRGSSGCKHADIAPTRARVRPATAANGGCPRHALASTCPNTRSRRFPVTIALQRGAQRPGVPRSPRIRDLARAGRGRTHSQ